MMKEIFENTLYNLFSQYNKISLTGFGYFEITRQSAYYNNKDHFFYPPQNSISFKNEAEKGNNILECAIAKTAGISESQAENEVSRRIDNICMQLAEQGSANLGAAGRLFLSPSGTIEFCLPDGSKILKDNFGLEEIKIQ